MTECVVSRTATLVTPKMRSSAARAVSAARLGPCARRSRIPASCAAPTMPISRMVNTTIPTAASIPSRMSPRARKASRSM